MSGPMSERERAVIHEAWEAAEQYAAGLLRNGYMDAQEGPPKADYVAGYMDAARRYLALTAPGDDRPWTKCADAMPPTRARYEFRFVGTPCYGMHRPWVVMWPEQPEQRVLDVQVPLLEWRPLPDASGEPAEGPGGANHE